MRSGAQDKYDETCQGWKAKTKWSAHMVMESGDKN